MYQENKEFTVYTIRRKNNWNVKNSKWNRKQGTKSRYATFVQKCKEEKGMGATPRPEHTQPQMERAEWMNLNGEWDFEFDFGNDE